MTSEQTALKDYPGDGIVVHWNASRCSHSARCASALPQVFRPSERPWVRTEGVGADDLAAAIDQCPSGALSYTRAAAAEPDEPTAQDTAEDTGQEAAAPAVLTVYADGPYVLAGAVQIRNGAGDVVKTVDRVALCRCGHSENKPYCDGSHKAAGFTDPGPSPA